MNWGEGEGGRWMVLRVVWTGWWTHCYWCSDSWTHEVGPGQRVASAVAVGGEGEGCRWASGDTDWGVV